MVGLMLGAAVGAVIGLLYAPRPGADARQDLAERSEDLYDRAWTARKRAEEALEKDERSAADSGRTSPHGPL